MLYYTMLGFLALLEFEINYLSILLIIMNLTMGLYVLTRFLNLIQFQRTYNAINAPTLRAFVV